MMNEAILVPEINAQGLSKEVSVLFPFLGKSAVGSRTKNVHRVNRALYPFLPMLKEGLAALNMIDDTAPSVSGKNISLKMEKGGAVKGKKITEGEPAIKKDQMSGAENEIVSQKSDTPQDMLFRILLLFGLPVKENSQDGPFVTPKDEVIKTHERQIRNKEEIILPLSSDTNQLDAIIGIISEALKSHGIEDDRIGEILSEIKDNGLFAAEEGRKPALPTGKSIREYGAEAPGVERATNPVYEMKGALGIERVTNPVYEMPEALVVERPTDPVYEMPKTVMKPVIQEERASTIRIIREALKSHGIEDDRIGEILSEIKDKGLFTAEGGRKAVLPPGKSIREYGAEAPGIERATNPVYEMQEALGVERATNPVYEMQEAPGVERATNPVYEMKEALGIGRVTKAVYEMPEALVVKRATDPVYEMPKTVMKPVRQEERASTIRIISEALKSHGIEDDRIGEILSEIKDKGLFTAEEGRKAVLPPGKSIRKYDAEALGVERAMKAVYEMPEALGRERPTDPVYEMPEAVMKPVRQEEQASTIRIISEALKSHGIEDDRIGEILSEIKDKGLFTAKEGRKAVLPPGKSIREYDAEALGVERAMKAVYEMPEAHDVKRATKAVYEILEAVMKPWRREEETSTGRASFPDKRDLLSIVGDKNISDIRTSSDVAGNDHAYDRKLLISLVFEKTTPAREHDRPMTVSAYGGSAAVNKAGDAPYIEGRLLVNQIANQLSDEAGKGFGRIKITLSPQHLGDLDMDIVVRENKVHVVMTAEHHDVQQALQGHADQLKSALQQQGLQVHTIDFLLQGGHHGRDGGLGGGNLWWQEENRKSENRNERAGKPSLAEIASSASRQKERQGVDGISVFV